MLIPYVLLLAIVGQPLQAYSMPSEEACYKAQQELHEELVQAGLPFVTICKIKVSVDI